MEHKVSFDVISADLDVFDKDFFDSSLKLQSDNLFRDEGLDIKVSSILSECNSDESGDQDIINVVVNITGEFSMDDDVTIRSIRRIVSSVVKSIMEGNLNSQVYVIKNILVI